jgi:hypothetical protein
MELVAAATEGTRPPPLRETRAETREENGDNAPTSKRHLRGEAE